VVAGLGIVQLLPPFPGVQWRRNQSALRRSEPIPQSVLPRILVVTITGAAALSAVVLLVSAVR